MAKSKELLLNPVRMRIVQHLATAGSATVSDLAAHMQDVPRTTLYRHVNLLAQHGFLTVCGEEQKRGTTEREYALATATEGDAQDYQEDTRAVLLGLLAAFEAYFARPDADPVGQRYFLGVNTLLLDDTEFEALVEEIFGAIKARMDLPAAPGRRVRRLAVISAPAGEEEEGEEAK